MRDRLSSYGAELFGSKVLRCLVAIFLILDLASVNHYVRVIYANDKVVGRSGQRSDLEGEPE